MIVPNLFISTDSENSNSDYDEINNEITKALNEMESQQEEDTNPQSAIIGDNACNGGDEYSFDSNSSSCSNRSSQSAYLNNNRFSAISNQLFPFSNSTYCGSSPLNYNPSFNHNDNKNYKKSISNPFPSFTSTQFPINQFYDQQANLNLNLNLNRNQMSNQYNRQNTTPNMNMNQNLFTNSQIQSQNQKNQINFYSSSHCQYNPKPKHKSSNINSNTSYSISNNSNINSNNSNSNNTSKINENPKNKIHLENILRKKEKRTTLMIRNIPNKFILKQFVEEINLNFKNQYDMVYLPVDRDNKCNLGYAFINFLDPMIVISFYDIFNGHKWTRFNSEKRCELAYAKIQGKDELLKQINKSCTDESKNAFTIETKIKPSFELPLKYLQAFINFYPYSSYRIINNDRFIIDSYYNF